MGSPDGQEAYRNVIKTVNDATANSSLQVNVVGGALDLRGYERHRCRDQHMIEIATVWLVFSILVLVYRSLVAMLMPLMTIGISLVVAQQIVAGLGELGLGLGPQTMMLMTGMMMGAGIDYGVFLYSRYQELTKAGMASDDALVEALRSIGEVIAGSAGTVAITFLGHVLHQDGHLLHRGTGPVGDHRGRLPGVDHAAPGVHRARRPAGMDQTATRHHRTVLAAVGRHDRPPARRSCW